MARGRDSLDHLIERWALVRRELLGWREPNQAWEWLGAPHCTLSTVRDHYDGAGATGEIKRHFPEVYSDPFAFEINQAFHKMQPTLREIMDAHYAIPGKAKVKSYRMGITLSDYWARVDRARTYVIAWLDSKKAA